MSAPQKVGTHPTPGVKMTRAEAGPAPLPGMVWNEEIGDFIPLGQQFALDRAAKEADPAFALAQYDKRREMLLGFVASKLQECEYDKSGYPLKGKMHDYYILPGYDKKTATKQCASKVADLLRLRASSKRVTSATFTADHGSARVAVDLVNADGRPAGSHEAACSTAEAGFRSMGARKKYGARYEGSKEVEPPDYRAAENDIVSRAGKRAFVGAVIVAASLEEVFDIESSTDAAGDRDDAAGQAPAPQSAAPSRQSTGRTDGPKMAFGENKGAPLASLESDALTRVRDWCIKKDAVKWNKFIGEIDGELDARRIAEAEEAGL